MKIQSNSVFLLILSLLLLNSCKQNDNEEGLSSKQEIIIHNSINRCITDSIIKSESYLINPRFGKFEFDSYMVRVEKEKSKEINKPIIFKKLGWDNDKFEDLQSEVNNKYQDKINNDLLNLSKEKKSNYVFTFSGIDENMIFIEIIYYCDKITRQQLKEGFDVGTMPKREIYSLIALLDDENISEILFDNSGVFELQCDNEFDE